MVRVIRFQSLVMCSGMTGSMSNSFWARSYGPMPKAVLFWSGKLIRSAIGFCAAFASAAVLASSDSASAGPQRLASPGLEMPG